MSTFCVVCFATKTKKGNYIVFFPSYQYLNMVVDNIETNEYIYRYTYEMIELLDGTLLTISPVNRKAVRNRILREEK